MTSLKLFRIAVEYVRVSTSLQDEMLSGDAQSFHIAPEAEKKGFRIAKRFGETGSGTSVSKRAVFLALIDYCLDPANKVEAVWFYDPSRYTRDIADFYHYIGKLTAAGIEIHSVTLGQYIPGNEASEIIWGFNVLFNAIMPRQSARKTRDTQYEAARKGYYLGRKAPFGYRKYKVTVGGKEHSKLEPDPEHWDEAVKMWEMGLDKHTPRQVAEYNNSLGITDPDGNEWTDRSVRSFYSKVAYKGETSWGEKQKSELIPNGVPVARCENAHKAMVKPKEWDTVQGYIDERRTAQSGPRSSNSPNPLVGKTVCGLCNASMHAQRRDDGIRYLICSRKKNRGVKTCASENVPFEDVLRAVMSELLEKVLTRETLDRQIAVVAEENASFLSEQQNKSEQLQQAQSRTRRQIKNLVKAIEDPEEDVVSPTLYRQLNQREAELEQLEAQSKELEAIMGDHLLFLNDPDRIVKNALDLRTYLESEDPRMVGLLLECFIEKVVVHNKTDGTIHWTIPLPSDAPDPPNTQGIQLSGNGGSKSYPLGQLVPNCRWAEVRPHSEEPEKYVKRVLGFLAEVEE